MQTTPLTNTSVVYDLPEEHTSSHSSRRCSTGNDLQGSGGSNPQTIHKSRVLQQNICGPEKFRSLEAGNRPESPKQNDIINKIQDGNASERLSISESGGMDDVNRLEGCVLPYPNTSQVKEVSEICLGDSGPTVQGLMFRTLHGTTSIHENDGSNSGPVSSEGYQTSPLLGRLVNSIQDCPRITTGDELGSSGNREFGPDCEQRKIGFSPLSETYLPGDGNKYRTGKGISGPQEGRKTSTDSSTIQGSRTSVSLGVASPDRSPSVVREISSLGTNAFEITTIPSKETLVSGDECKVDNGTYFRRSYSRPDMVDRPGKLISRDPVSPSSTRCPTFYGRLDSRLGCTFIRPTGIRPLGSIGNKSSYQFIGTQSGEIRPSIISGTLSKQENISHVRQFNSGCSYKEPGGDKVMVDVSEDTRSSKMVLGTEHNSNITLYSGQEKCISGPAQQKESSTSSRVVPTPRNLHENLEDLGVSSCGFVCHKIKSQTSSLLLTGSGPISLGSRLHDDTMGQIVRLCVPSTSTSTKSNFKINTVQEHQISINSPSLAPTALVCRDIIPVNRPSQEAANVENSLETTTHQQISSNSRDIPISRVDVIERGIRARGFSQKAASCMARPNRKSTLALYQAKWAQFCSWCRQRKTDPLSSTIPIIADFFLFLREDKNLSCTAIKGYRSALAQVFIHRGLDISSSPEISMLFRNFEQSIPPRTISQPKWDLNIVLQSLTRPPFEPINSISLRNLTLKTVFLLALATAKRVSEIHGLSYLVAWSADYSSATLEFTPDFVAKTQVPGDPSTAYKPITIPALSNMLGQDELDNLLCPLRALKTYLSKTAAARPKCLRLFVSSVATFKHKSVTKNTISFWIRTVIKNAYNSVQKDDLLLWKISAHEVRALATSLLFKHNHSLKDVMAAASWKSNSTFVSFYLRDTNHKFLDLSAIDRVVAAQTVIPSTSGNENQQRNPQAAISKKKGKKRGERHLERKERHKRV